MAGLSISPPGVSVIQEFVSTSPSAITPFLPTVYVGPALQVISAFDDLGNPLDDAFAGTYRDGEGQIAYDLPSLVAEASLLGFEEDVRIFLVAGAEVNELNSEDDEEVIIEAGSGGDFISGTPDTFTDVTQLFQQIGVEVGDVVRITYLAEPVDLEITAVLSDTVLELASSVIVGDQLGLDYDIIRNPAQYIFAAIQQANTEIGDPADFLRLTAQLLKTDGLTPAEYIGSKGDDLTFVITDSERFIEGPDLAVGASVFQSNGAPFVSVLGPIGPVTGFHLVTGDTSVATNGLVLREVQGVGGVNFIAIEPGEALGASPLDFQVISEQATGDDGVTVGTAVFTSAAATFDVDIPNGGVPGAPNFVTRIEIEGDGVYDVVNIDSPTQLTLASVTGTAVAQNYTIGRRVLVQADGATGTLSEVLSISVGGFGAITSPTTKSVTINVNGPSRVISTIDSARRLTVAAPFIVSNVERAFVIVETDVPVDLSFESDLDQITLRLPRVDGQTQGTFAAVFDSITNIASPAYNDLVADVTDAALGGTVADGATNVPLTDLPIVLQYDGGSDDEQLLLDADLLGSSTPTAQVYVSYKALRVDLSAASGTFEKALFIENQDQRELLLGSATVDNPLSLAVSFGLINSPTQGVFALGVGEVSAAKPEGTVASYTQAFEALEPLDVHLINPLTQDLTVAQILQVHVGAMSAPDQKSERIGFFNSALPTHKTALVLASGTEGNSGTGEGASPLQMTTLNPASFRTSVNLALAGAQAGDFLVVTAFSGSDPELEPVNGTLGPLYGLEVIAPPTQFGDDFILQVDASGLTDTSFDSLIDVNWTLYRPGISIDQQVDQAEVIAETSEGFLDRRMYHHWPDQATADVDGTEFLLPGYYVMSGWSGKANQTTPQQGFSNGTIAGYTGIRHSNGYFNKGQLDRIAGGGTWITIQDSQNAPLKCRHQLSTDSTSVEKREFSITRIVDYVAKYLRLGLDRQVGRFNITKSYLDALSTTIQGLLLSLEESGKLIAASLITLEVDEVAPDKINVIVAIDVPFPANFIEITLQI